MANILINLGHARSLLYRASLKLYSVFLSDMTHVAKVVELIGNSDKGWEAGAPGADKMRQERQFMESQE